MVLKIVKSLKWMSWLLFYCLITTLPAKAVTSNQAKLIAENWIGFILQRDGQWGGSEIPTIKEFREFKRGDLLLGYYAEVDPQGYIIVSTLKDFAPIKAYSTTSNLDPNNEVGMCALLKDVLESRNRFLIEAFGGLDEASLNDLSKHTPDSYRRAWSILSTENSAGVVQLQSMQAPTAAAKGPFLKSRWGQGEPFNDKCPDMSCPGAFNDNAKVGCVPLAMAQIMRFFCWPPFFGSEYYDWPNTLVNEAHYDAAHNWYNDENGTPWTQAQIDAVAKLCHDPGTVLGDIDYNCDKTSAHVCNWYYHDVRDAFEDDFYYDTEGDEPDCEDRDEHSYEEWWSIIKNEVDHNRPMAYAIQNSGNDFFHAIVVDGYDDTSGQYKVHANYGWSGGWHDNWYDLDWFDCDNDAGWNLRCEWDEESMVRDVYPRNGICEWYTGTLSAWGGAGTLHHYIYCDTHSNNLTIQGGARVQFLPEVSLICNGNTITIEGGAPHETRLFSDGMPTRGLKVSTGGKVKLRPNGAVTVY